MAWTSSSFKVKVRQSAPAATRPPVSPEVREAINDLAARADTYADVRKKRVQSIRDRKLRESVSK